MVFFGVDPQREQQTLSIMRQFILPKEAIVTSEEFSLELGEKLTIDFRKVVINKITFEKIQIISLVLAQSTALEYFETIADDLLKKSGTITDILEKQGRTGVKDKDLVKFIGFCLNTKQKIIASTYILDNPDPTWESQTLEHLYRQMIDMFEIRERYRTLEYKLRTVQDTVEILADLSSTRRTLYLESAIVGLIVIEILLFVYGMMRPS